VKPLLLAAALWAMGGHEAPRPETKSVVPETLAEMWQRRILSMDATSWSPEDMALLKRIRGAEKLGAFPLLRKRFGTLKPYTVVHKGTTRLTKPGYEKYLFAKTQDALRWFETREIPAKDAYQLKTEDGKPVFDGAGHLTEAGDVLYTRVLHNLPTYWVLPSGEVQGNRPPKRR
jgi:hypothetical protein